jgi:hypothetical protein
MGAMNYGKTAENVNGFVFRQSESGIGANKAIFKIQSDKIVAEGGADIKGDLWLGNETMQY